MAIVEGYAPNHFNKLDLLFLCSDVDMSADELRMSIDNLILKFPPHSEFIMRILVRETLVKIKSMDSFPYRNQKISATSPPVVPLRPSMLGTATLPSAQV